MKSSTKRNLAASQQSERTNETIVFYHTVTVQNYNIGYGSTVRYYALRAATWIRLREARLDAAE
jgi:hypothetical protein